MLSGIVVSAPGPLVLERQSSLSHVSRMESRSTSSRISEKEVRVRSRIVSSDLDDIFQCEIDQFDFDEELEVKQDLEDIECGIIPLTTSFFSKDDQNNTKTLVESIIEGFHTGYSPKLAPLGTGGTYFLYDSGHTSVGVLKPSDEEALAPMNPRGHVGVLGQEGLRKGIFSGEACLREVAAYLIDAEKHFIGVPFTCLVDIRHKALHHKSNPDWKKASLQEFVKFDELGSDLSHRLFPSSQVHKIGILDIRMVNTDRNDGNILIKRTDKGLDLIPIDHGYCLPDTLEIAWCDWVWLDWRQSKIPFDELTKEYIAGIDIDHDENRIRTSLGIREESLLNMRINTMLLKKGSAAGLCLHQIAKIICRDQLDAPSLLEIIIAQAKVIARNRMTLFIDALESLMDDLVYRKSSQPSSFRVRQELDRIEPNPAAALPSTSVYPMPITPAGMAQHKVLTPGTLSPEEKNPSFHDPRYLNIRMSI